MTFKRVWPAIKLANSRTPKLIGLKMYDTNSIGISNQAKNIEVFAGINNESIRIPCFFIHIIFRPIKTDKDKVKVIERWLVIVKL